MANHHVRRIATISIILVLALAGEAKAREADCSDVVSPISGVSFRGLIWRAIDLGATRAELYSIVARSRCRVYLENIIKQSFNQGANHG